MKPASFVVPVLYLLVTVVLLTVPGNEFPKAKLFHIKGGDKVVHVGMFLLLTWCFCYPFKASNFSYAERKSWFIKIAISALVYGIIMEIVQKYFVPNRSFEMADILVDGIGALLGCLISLRTLAVRKVA